MSGKGKKTQKKRVVVDEIGRHKALVALFQCNSIAEVAEQSGLSRRTIYNYLNCDPAFRLLYEKMKQAQLEQIISKVQSGADKAIDYLVFVMENENESTTTRLSAAFKLAALQVSFSAAGQRNYKHEFRHEAHMPR